MEIQIDDDIWARYVRAYQAAGYDGWLEPASVVAEMIEDEASRLEASPKPPAPSPAPRNQLRTETGW